MTSQPTVIESLKDIPRRMSIDEDTLQGVAMIAAFIGKNQRQTHWLLETKRLPAFKLGQKWHMRRSTYEAFITRLEAETMLVLKA